MADKPEKSETVKGAFGAKNRARLINLYFGEQSVESASAWVHVYRLLVWIDQTTGLAHCYESDKAQPGKPWYGRSLSFHAWLSSSFGVEPKQLVDNVDWLFRRATSDLAEEVVRRAEALRAAAMAQRAPFGERDMPQPGEDPELISIIREVLGDRLSGDVDSETWQRLVQRIRQYLALENKRRNLVGEGFEDVLAEVIQRKAPDARLEILTRKVLHELPGFNRERKGDKRNKVDLAVLRPEGGMRTIVTAKWSLRADREKQFQQEYAEYVAAESDRRPFEYVFVTNEFDPARLMRACEQLAGNQHMFTHVVHINPDALVATYSDADAGKAGSIKHVLRHITDGRLIGVDRWIEILAQE